MGGNEASHRFAGGAGEDAIASVWRAEAVNEDAWLGFDRFDPNLFAGKSLGLEDDIKRMAFRGRCGAAFQEPFDVMYVVDVSVQIDIAPSSAQGKRVGGDFTAMPADFRRGLFTEDRLANRVGGGENPCWNRHRLARG